MIPSSSFRHTHLCPVTVFSNVSSLISTPNDTSLASNWTTPLLYIDTNPAALNQAGFAPEHGTNYTTTGFAFWGRSLIYSPTTDDDSVGRSFWAAPQGETGFWNLLWNADNSASANAVPVVLKREPPPTIDRK